MEDAFSFTFDPIRFFPRASHTSCSVGRLLWPQERLLFSYKVKCLLLVFIDSPRRGPFMTRMRGPHVARCRLREQRSATGVLWASPGSSARTSSFFYINSQRSCDSSCTSGADPAGRGTYFTEAITPSADVSDSSSSAVTITYITEQPAVLSKHQWPWRWEHVSLTKFELCRCMLSIHWRAPWY